MFDPLYNVLISTLRSNDKIIFDGQYDVGGGEHFRVNFHLKSPAPGNKAEIDLSPIFESYPDGFAVQRISDIDHTAVRMPVDISGKQREEIRGTFLLVVTKANWNKGTDGVSGSGENAVADENDLSLTEIIDRYSKLPEHKRKQFVTAAKLLLKGLAL